MSSDTLRGFVLARRALREHDLRVTLLLEDGRRVEALAPSGQQSRQRFSAGLTLLALYRVGLTFSRRGARLDDAVVERGWTGLLTDLRRQTAAVTATGIAEELAEPVPHDPWLFLLLAELYDTVSSDAGSTSPGARLVRFTLEALDHAGHGLALDRCVRCNATVPALALVTVDPAAGGVVCRSCGGGPYRLTALDRLAFAALHQGDLASWRPGLVGVLSSLVAGVAPRSAELLARAAPLFTS